MFEVDLRVCIVVVTHPNFCSLLQRNGAMSVLAFIMHRLMYAMCS